LWFLSAEVDNVAINERRMGVVVDERSFVMLVRIFDDEESSVLLFLVVRRRTYWSDCGINGDDATREVEFKWSVQMLTKWSTQSNKLAALGNFRCDKQKKASMKAGNGNPINIRINQSWFLNKACI